MFTQSSGLSYLPSITHNSGCGWPSTHTANEGQMRRWHRPESQWGIYDSLSTLLNDSRSFAFSFTWQGVGCITDWFQTSEMKEAFLVIFFCLFSIPLEFRTLGRQWLKNAKNSSPTQLGMCPAWSSWQKCEDCLIRPSLWNHRTWGCTLPRGRGCRPEPLLTQTLLNIPQRLLLQD